MTIKVVASKKMINVLQNMNICPGEWNKDPLELRRGEGKAERPIVSRNENHAHRSILIEMQYKARNIPNTERGEPEIRHAGGGE